MYSIVSWRTGGIAIRFSFSLRTYTVHSVVVTEIYCRKENTGSVLSQQFFDAEGEPRWNEIVKFCNGNPARTSLKPNEQEFIDEMLVKLRWRSPTRPMGGFLLSIFWKLGGTFK